MTDASTQSPRPARDLFTPLAIYLAAAVVFVLFGYGAVETPWNHYQILDRPAIEQAPFRSLFLLHSQPPLLNALIAATHRAGALLHINPEIVRTILFHILGALGSVLFYLLALRIAASRPLAAIALAVLLADPAYHVFQHLFFYPFLLHFLVIALLFSAWRFLDTDRHLWLAATFTVLALMVNLRTLFHPLWAIAFAALVLILHTRRHRLADLVRSRRLWFAAAFLALALVAWPLKNMAAFGAFTFSSWNGFNLTRGTPVESPELQAYRNQGIVSPQARDAIDRFAARFGSDRIGLLANVAKSDGSLNWNHIVFLRTRAELARKAIRWRLAHPGAWARAILLNYVNWTMPSYVHPYSREIRGPETPRFGYPLYASLHRHTLFPYLGGPCGPQPEWGEPPHITLFAVIGWPLSVAVVGIVLWRLRRALTPETTVLLLAAFVLAWVFLVPNLTDGREGNRMRFCAGPCLLLFWTALAGEVARRFRKNRP